MTMKKNMRTRLLSLLLLCSATGLLAQSWPEKVLLDWQGLYMEEVSEGKTVSYLFFTDAYLQDSDGFLYPTWHQSIRRAENQALNLTISEAEWEKLSEEEAATLPKPHIDTLTQPLQIRYGYTRHQSFVEISLVPFRKAGGHYEKLRSFRLSGQWVPVNLSHRLRQKSYPDHSVLASGDIYKISLTETGIHKLTYAVMSQMGVPMSGLNIRQISIYGNGGALMPENTDAFVYDDPEEIPVHVVDANGNGIFEPEDYLLFYGQGIVDWHLEDNTFVHSLNFYSDYAFYFVKINRAPTKSIGLLPSDSRAATHTQTSYNYHTVMEKDLISPTEMGRVWFQDLFDVTTSRNYQFALPALVSGEKVNLMLRMASVSPASSYVIGKANGGNSLSVSFPVSGGIFKSALYSFIPSSSVISLDLTYSKPTNSSKAWLDYLEINTLCQLRQTSAQVGFRCLSSVGEGNVTEYRLDAQGHSLTIWEVTDPCNYREVQYVTDNGNAVFRLSSDSLREFVSFYGGDFPEVTPVGKVANQDLHALEPVDFVIITAPDFLSVARDWADFRTNNDGMKTAVVTTSQIYNEFGSGMQDVAAIRNFLRMLYLRHGSQAPKNVMLLGKVSFDFRNRLQASSNYIPNYQGQNIFSEETCLSTDDFFVKLDDNEGMGNSGSMDMGIGRVPVSTLSQARTVLEKVKMYASREAVSGVTNTVSNMADWRNVIAFCADDDADGQGHLHNADRIAQQVSDQYPLYNLDKIYMDAYKKVSTSQGQRYPEATEAINQRVNKGCLIFTYMGHGGDNGWAHERVLRRSDIYSWSNRYALPLFYAGSCGFGEYDKLSSVSPSEDMLFKSDGGAIGVISASRSSYGGSNENFGKSLHRLALQSDSAGRHLTVGEVFSKAKNSCGSVQMYVCFGDPSMTLCYPQLTVRTDSVNGVSFGVSTDTLQALGYVTVSGHVARADGSVASDFNGYVSPVVFDKTATVVTLLNNAISTEKRFQMQKNSLFKGKINVKNGYFRFGFLLPKDLNYDYGYGKISYYACGSGTDAAGYDSVVIGGLSDTLINDENGPEITLYLNDESFANGGISSSSPTLLAHIRDESGINAAGAGIGHDIVAVLDNDESQRILLNDYYECDENSSLSGKVSYLLPELSEGEHTISLRAWDVLNNRGEASISFTVVNNKEISLSHLLNYPNPFTTRTQFYFEHNQLNTDLDIRIQIFTVSGKLVKTITEKVIQANAYRCGPFEWDGRDDFGGRLAKGTYVYKLSVRNSMGKVAEKIEKLVIL